MKFHKILLNHYFIALKDQNCTIYTPAETIMSSRYSKEATSANFLTSCFIINIVRYSTHLQ